MEVRPAERQLLVEGRPAHIGARAFDVLLALIDHRDRVVAKDELFDLAWPGLVVEENNLHVQVSTLRKVLGAQSVATIPGRGFRFVPVVEVIDAPSCPLPPRNHNLPAQLNSFIGREPELAKLRELMSASRLVTLTGTGGTGKTRLSLQAAYEIAAEYPDGIWLAELAPLADPLRVPQALASVLGVKEDAGRPVGEALVRYVRDRKMLLVFDNCEHLLDACARLAKELLQAAPNVRILASSREPLHVAGETVYPLPALSLPPERESAAALGRYDSVRLFVDRATAVQPAFKVNGNASAVSAICRRLDGIPLAIELAAARVGSLPVDQIASRLSDALAVLKGGDRTTQSRQQTLRASIDWSYDLLEIPERELFRRLAVFAGGWTLEAAEAVCVGGDVAHGEAIDYLTRLTEKSLVDLDASGDRYRLLDTVRQYAQELLAASGEEDGVRERHLAYYGELASKARQGIAGPDQGSWISRMDEERENILSAHAWCDHAAHGAKLGLQLARDTKLYWINRGLLGQGHRVVADALARPGAHARDELRCRALFDAGQLAFFMGRYGEAQRYLEESLVVARALASTQRIAAALQPLGMSCLGQGNLAAARTHLEEALELARSLGNKRDLAAAMNAMGALQRVQGSLDDAQRLYEDSVALFAEVGDHESRAIALLNLAMVAIQRNSRDSARALLAEAIAISESVGLQRVGLCAIEACAGFSAACGDYTRAARFYGVAEAQNGSTGLHRDPADEAFLAPLMEKARAELAARYRTLEDSGRALAYGAAIAEASAWLSAKVTA
ncbi:MAG TPA: tetratricopeptide repeat protein [Usitatibacter sp.]|nr:tetratricopeptide repeat protein [Usitatibacter sp.]